MKRIRGIGVIAFLAGAFFNVTFGQNERSIAITKDESPAAITLQPFLSGLSSPVFMTRATDRSQRLFIVQQGGLIRVLQPGSTTPTTFLDISGPVLAGGERGLLGLAFHPQYRTNRRFFVYYTADTPAGAIKISEFQVSATNPNVADTTEKNILTIPHSTNSNHNGGTVAFGPDGYLYAGPGDGGGSNDVPNNAQNINSLLGKIIRLDVDNVPVGQVPQYNVPPDNPYAGAIPGADEIYAIGMPIHIDFHLTGAVRGNCGRLMWVSFLGKKLISSLSAAITAGVYMRAYIVPATTRDFARRQTICRRYSNTAAPGRVIPDARLQAVTCIAEGKERFLRVVTFMGIIVPVRS
ncbi:MAG: PQQ-dependent sugar dehydrogenase [Chloracidobacterium sp.]|nr:PQQ-dependent sugar dehydrogenase [Chloracidobacterium sp.]